MSKLRLASLVVLFLFTINIYAETPLEGTRRIVDSVVKVVDDTGGGSGFLLKYKNKNYIVTAGHVCGESTEMSIIPLRSKRFKAKVLKASLKPDICIIDSSIKGLVELTEEPENCNYDAIKVGYPNLLGMRIIKSTQCESVFFKDAIPGESGGPLFDRTKKVVGMTLGVFEVGDKKFAYILSISKLRSFINGL